MLAILTMLFGVLGKIPGAVGDYFKLKNETTLAKQQADLEIQRENIKLAAEVARSQFELQKAIVLSTGAYFKYFTFAMWYCPFLASTISEKWGQMIFHNWESMPQWYVTSCITIMFTIWGIQVSAPVVTSIFQGVAQFFAERKDAKRNFQLEKEKLFNDKLAYEKARELFGGTMNQATVDVLKQIFEAGAQVKKVD